MLCRVVGMTIAMKLSTYTSIRYRMNLLVAGVSGSSPTASSAERRSSNLWLGSVPIFVSQYVVAILRLVSVVAQKYGGGIQPTPFVMMMEQQFLLVPLVVVARHRRNSICHQFLLLNAKTYLLCPICHKNFVAFISFCECMYYPLEQMTKLVDRPTVESRYGNSRLGVYHRNLCEVMVSKA